MSVLHVERKEQEVRLRVDFRADWESWCAAAVRNESCDFSAALLAEKLRHVIAVRAAEIRREAYNAGCRDRRLGRPKQTNFSGDF
jgi:hypothetical protein